MVLEPAVTLSRKDEDRIRKEIKQMTASQIQMTYKYLCKRPDSEYAVVRKVLKEFIA